MRTSSKILSVNQTVMARHTIMVTVFQGQGDASCGLVTRKGGTYIDWHSRLDSTQEGFDAGVFFLPPEPEFYGRCNRLRQLTGLLHVTQRVSMIVIGPNKPPTPSRNCFKQWNTSRRRHDTLRQRQNRRQTLIETDYHTFTSATGHRPRQDYRIPVKRGGGLLVCRPRAVARPASSLVVLGLGSAGPGPIAPRRPAAGGVGFPGPLRGTRGAGPAGAVSFASGALGAVALPSGALGSALVEVLMGIVASGATGAGAVVEFLA